MSQHAIDNAKAWFQSIREMVAAFDNPAPQDVTAIDAAEQAILESPLSVQVRSGWYSPSARDADTKPAEYEILLTSGGPALRIVGELSEHGEPETASLQWQDWGTPWTYVHYTELWRDGEMPTSPDDVDATLLNYVRHFDFGE